MMNFYLKELERLKINFSFTIYVGLQFIQMSFLKKYEYEMTK